VELIEAKSDAM
jgi:hypothetical protein